MSRTQGRYDSDTGWGDGQIFIPASAGNFTSGTGTLTRNASGSVSVNIAAGATTIMLLPLADIIFRYGVQDWLQEQFGSLAAGGAQGFTVSGYTAVVTTSASAGSAVNVAVGSSTNFTVGRFVLAGTQKTYITAIPDSTHITLATLTATLTAGSFISENLFTTPAGVTGTPPFTGVTNLTPVTSPRPKGIYLRQIYPVYAAAGAALTTNTIGITKTVFANNVAPVVTNILTNAANGLATATNAQPYLTPIPIPTPAWQTTKFAEYVIEWDVTTAGGGTAQLFGIFMDIAFNFN